MPHKQDMGHQGRAALGINPPLRPWFGPCLAVAHAISRQQIMDTLLLNRFQGPDGKLHLVEALRAQTLVRDEDLAVELARRVTLKAIPAGTVLITQNATDRDLFLILGGKFSVTINGRVVASRSAGEHVGEMGVVDPDARRSASVSAVADSVVARITELEFSALADRFPRLWRRIALELASRLRARNEMLSEPKGTTTVSRGA
jgi:CRP/FNR family transcriptional regulator, cyclic AMP receptor protein